MLRLTKNVKRYTMSMHFTIFLNIDGNHLRVVEGAFFMSTQTQIKENKMGVMPENRLLVTMSLPIVISMIVQALYNIVDSYFVAQISEKALTAVSLAFPVQNLMIAFAVGTGVGINALLSKSLGEKNFKLVNKTAVNSLFLTFINFVIFALLGAFLSGAFIRTQTASGEIIDMSTSYLHICTVASMGLFFSVTFERLLQSTGKSIFSMITQGTGAIINIILDPILIFGYFGLPAMGVAGAAWATVIGQIMAAILGLILNLKFNNEISLKLKGFRPSGSVIGRIYSVGLPSIILQSIGSVMVYGMNQILISFSETATALYGVYFRLQSFVFMPVFGLNNGVVPIIAYNYGAKRKDRILKTYKLAIIYAVTIMLIGMIVFLVFPSQLLGIFNASDTMLEIGIPALRIISFSFILAGFSICTSSVFQALGRGFISLVMSIVRQLVVLLPVAFLLSRTGEISSVWWAHPISELFSFVISVVAIVSVYKKTIKNL